MLVAARRCHVAPLRRPLTQALVRQFHDDPTGLKGKLGELIPKWRVEMAEFKKAHGEKSLGEVKVSQCLQGMRDIKGMFWETSLLDANEGIRFRGLSIPECQARLPKAPGGEEPLPEALFYLLITGEVPTADQTKRLSAEFAARSELPEYTKKLIASFPKGMHPMTQFGMAILSLQGESKFQKAYNSGTLKKADYWVHTLEDAMDLVAKVPTVAAGIFRHSFFDGTHAFQAPDMGADLSLNFSKALGPEFGGNDLFVDMMRMYLVIHSDHEGGNVSAHTTHLVGSALSDAYLSLSAGMCGLAGPLHGLANQECLKFQKEMQSSLGQPPYTEEAVRKATWDVLNKGQVVPGFGHAVLRQTDPRYVVQREFAQRHFPNDPLIQLVSQIYQVVPGVLTEHGKTKNPWPNVDAHSGAILQHFGMNQENFYTVLFGVSRTIGVLAQLVIDRALGLPLERPKSVTMEWLKNNFKDQPADK